MIVSSPAIDNDDATSARNALSSPPLVLEVLIVDGLDKVSAEAWDALVGDDNPFVEHAFLRLLETTGSVGPDTGWMPAHLLVQSDEQLVGAAPTYVKTDSYGEYIFDWAWAEAAMRAGIDYYPKLVVGVPFTPATGPRLLVHPDADTDRVSLALMKGLEKLTTVAGASGVHVLFAMDDEAERLDSAGFARRATQQYHWFNDGYGDFEDFLGAFKASARKQIRKERRRVTEAGLSIELLRGSDAEPAIWSTMSELYRSTYQRKWGRPYLTEAFFDGAAEAIGERAIIVVARAEGEVVAATLSFEKGRHLYGRYWGAFQAVDGLHFELCYYRLIEHAIATGKTLFEAGAQGQHKLRRGFVPVAVHSAHHITHPGLHDAVADFVAGERIAMHEELALLSALVPFRRDEDRARPRSAGSSAAGLFRLADSR